MWAYDGTDTCLNTERARSCEVREAPGRVRARPAVVTCAGRPATIVGTARNNRIQGTPGPDVIAGRGGNDRIDGLGGDDVLCGGPGDDELTSYEQSRDILVGGAGDDFVGSFENPYAVVRLGAGDDYASSQIGRGTGWSLDAGPGYDRVYLHLTRAMYDAGSKPGSADLRTGKLRVGSSPPDASPAGRTSTCRPRFAGGSRAPAPTSGTTSRASSVSGSTQGVATTRSSAPSAPTRSTREPARTP